MKRIGLLLLACLLLALPTVAQAPEKAAPDDLVVTAEIVGYSKPGHKGKENCMLHAKMIIWNTTNHPSEINMMSCSWDTCWLISNKLGVFEAAFVDGCDKNFPTTITIPAGESLVFNGPLILMNGYIAKHNEITGENSFRLGFLDRTLADVWNGIHAKTTEEMVLEKLKRAKAVYWSNALTTEIDPATTKEIYGKQFPNYHLTQGGK